MITLILGFRAFASFKTAMPSIGYIMRSQITRSKSGARNLSIASAPPEAFVTRYPRSSSAQPKTRRISGLSSTNRILLCFNGFPFLKIPKVSYKRLLASRLRPKSLGSLALLHRNILVQGLKK